MLSRIMDTYATCVFKMFKIKWKETRFDTFQKIWECKLEYYSYDRYDQNK